MKRARPARQKSADKHHAASWQNTHRANVDLSNSNSPVLLGIFFRHTLTSFKLPANGREPPILVTQDNARSARMTFQDRGAVKRLIKPYRGMNGGHSRQYCSKTLSDSPNRPQVPRISALS